MNNPFLVGITGGIGSGKSTVAELFKILGIPVYDADSRAKVLMASDQQLIDLIINQFGERAYQDGVLNRQYLAEKVFANAAETAKLNAFVHPVVARDFKLWTSNQKTIYVLKEAALLFEAGSYQELDMTILITAPVELRIKRVKARDPQRSEKQIMNIINRQMAVEKAIKLADETIVNNEKSLLIPEVIKLDAKIKEAII